MLGVHVRATLYYVENTDVEGQPEVMFRNVVYLAHKLLRLTGLCGASRGIVDGAHDASKCCFDRIHCEIDAAELVVPSPDNLFISCLPFADESEYAYCMSQEGIDNVPLLRCPCSFYYRLFLCDNFCSCPVS